MSTGHLHLNGFDSQNQPKRKGTPKDTFSFWSRIRESNPPPRLGNIVYSLANYSHEQDNQVKQEQRNILKNLVS